MNNDLRRQIVRIVTSAGEGHIPSSFSIVDILDTLYGRFLKFDPKNPEWADRDYFVLSKGHAAAGLFAVLHKYGYFSDQILDTYGKFDGILGGHPDRTKAPGAEASTGSLGHGLPFAMGIATGLKILGKHNKVVALVGDGECHEGTIWETALVAQNLGLRNFCCIVDNNGSAAQILPHPSLRAQWSAFGWQTHEVDGHNQNEIQNALEVFAKSSLEKPTCIIANTVKGKGVSFMEVHGPWHHKIPSATEFETIMKELT